MKNNVDSDQMPDFVSLLHCLLRPVFPHTQSTNGKYRSAFASMQYDKGFEFRTCVLTIIFIEYGSSQTWLRTDGLLYPLAVLITFFSGSNLHIYLRCASVKSLECCMESTLECTDTFCNGSESCRKEYITKTRLDYFYPLKPHFYIMVKLGFTG